MSIEFSWFSFFLFLSSTPFALGSLYVPHYTIPVKMIISVLPEKDKKQIENDSKNSKGGKGCGRRGGFTLPSPKDNSPHATASGKARRDWRGLDMQGNLGGILHNVMESLR